MRLSMETYGLRRRFGDYEAARLIREAGFDCVDYSCYYWKEQAHALEDGYREYARALRAHLDGLELSCNQSHAPFSMKYGQPFDPSDPEYRGVIRSMEVASILGAHQIIIHSIAMPEAQREDTEATHEYAMAYYRSLLPYAERFGIRIGVENLFVRYKDRKFVYAKRLNSPETLSRVVRELDSPWVTACLDMGHAAMVGYEPEDFIRGMDKGLLGAVHFQDGDYIEDRHTLPYLGQYHWAEIMKALAETGYTGDLTFEIYKYYQNLPDEAIPYALKMAETVGRSLIRIFQSGGTES
ncbi:MAG: sugar phosphate isomerase/epimerase [Clostridia bacterium]|nr:sugar phosphate isomerase/epimerase [Clostridia bacterium]